MRTATPPSEGPAGSSQPADEARELSQTKCSEKKNIGGTAEFRWSSRQVGGLSTPYQSEIAETFSKRSPRNGQPHSLHRQFSQSRALSLGGWLQFKISIKNGKTSSENSRSAKIS
ncbi:hypothetical protein MRX96_009066 [Rhipicephalus microplus]